MHTFLRQKNAGEGVSETCQGTLLIIFRSNNWSWCWNAGPCFLDPRVLNAFVPFDIDEKQMIHLCDSSLFPVHPDCSGIFGQRRWWLGKSLCIRCCTSVGAHHFASGQPSLEIANEDFVPSMGIVYSLESPCPSRQMESPWLEAEDLEVLVTIARPDAASVSSNSFQLESSSASSCALDNPTSSVYSDSSCCSSRSESDLFDVLHLSIKEKNRRLVTPEEENNQLREEVNDLEAEMHGLEDRLLSVEVQLF